jgi:Flp pilus assembly protein TadD
VARQCSVCHHPGDAAPFNLLSYEDVKKHATNVVKVTQSRYMPPWLPEPGYGEFANERRLSDSEIAMIKKWVDGGMPEGKVATIDWNQKWKEGWQLGQPDLIAQMPAQYMLPGEGRDVYRNFVVPLPLDSSRWVRAVELHPGNKRIVHHAFVYVDVSGSARLRDARDAEVGYEGMDPGEDVGTPSGQFLSWQPGKMPALGDEGQSWRMAKGTDIVLQLHMRPDGKPEPIQSSVGIYFSDKPPTQYPYVLLLRSTAIDIPAGDKDYIIESSYTLPVDADVVGILPHVHYLGKQLEGGATLPDGTTKPLILIKNWNFDWQGDYQYAKPVALPKGTKVWMKFHYDNSEQNVRNPNHPPKRVTYGQNSSDEMGELWVRLVPHNAEDLQKLAKDNLETYGMRDTIDRCRNVLKFGGEDANTRAKLGAALAKSGQVEEGLAELRKGLAVDANNPKVHYNLGMVLVGQGKVAEGMDELKKVLALDWDHYRAHNNLGMIYLTQGNPDLALQHFYNAVRINPNDVTANANLARVFLAQGKLGQAKLQLEALLNIEPDDANTKELLKRVSAEIEKRR